MRAASKKAALQIGDEVAYAVQFLRSIGEVSGPLPFARGTITALDSYGGVTIATIAWNDPEIPQRVNVANLARVGANSRFAAC